MKTLRITMSDAMFKKQDEREFQIELTNKLTSAGFDLQSDIIKQPRSDVKAVDFIQFRYSFLDKVDVQIGEFFWKIKRWFIIQFKK